MMTLAEYIACASPLEGEHMVQEHMEAATCEGLAGGVTYLSTAQSVIEPEVDIMLSEEGVDPLIEEADLDLVEEAVQTLISKNEGSIDGIC